MFAKPLNPELKQKLYENLRSNPETNVVRLRDLFDKEIQRGNIEVAKEVMRIVKFLIKDRITAKPKFFGLLLIKEFMETRHPQIIEYFTKKLMSRLFMIAQFEMRSKDLRRGERCLKRYYGQDSVENAEYSQKFFLLVLECWKHWAQFLADKYKKIKEKTDKLQSLFPVNDMYYNYFDKWNARDDRGLKSSALGHSQSINPSEFQYGGSKLSIDSSEDFIPQKHNFVFSANSLSKLDAKGIEGSNEMRQLLCEFLTTHDENTFYEHFTSFYTTIEGELESLKKNRVGLANLNDNAKFSQLQFNETAAFKELVECLTLYSKNEINYGELKDRVLQIERKFPYSSSLNQNAAIDLSFHKGSRNNRHKEEDNELNDLNTVKNFSEDHHHSNKKGQNGLNSNRSPENMKAPSNNFQTTFGIMEESNEDDSNWGPNSQGQGSSRFIMESNDEKNLNWLTSLDNPAQPHNLAKHVKGEVKTPKDKNKVENGWNYDFRTPDKDPIQEENAFGDFDGFDVTPKENTQERKSPNFEKKSNHVIKKELTLDPNNMRSNTFDDEPHANTPGFAKDHIRMNTIIEESKEDFDDSRPSLSKWQDSHHLRSLKIYSETGQTVTDEIFVDNVQIIFEDFKETSEHITTGISQDSRMTRSDLLTKGGKTGSRRGTQDSNPDKKTLSVSKISETKFKESIGQPVKQAIEVDDLPADIFSRFCQKADPDKDQIQHSDFKFEDSNSKFQKRKTDASEKGDNELKNADQFKLTEQSNQELDFTPQSKSLVEDKPKGRPFGSFSTKVFNANAQTPNFDFNFADAHPLNNESDQFGHGKALFDFKDFSSNISIGKEKPRSSKRADEELIRGIANAKPAETENEETNFEYDLEENAWPPLEKKTSGNKKDSLITHSLENKVGPIPRKKSGFCKSENKSGSLIQLQKDKDYDFNGTSFEHQKRNSEMLFESTNRNQLNGNIISNDGTGHPKKREATTVMRQNSSASKDNFEEAFEDEADLHKFITEQRHNTWNKENNGGERDSKIANTFGKPRNNQNTDKQPERRNSFQVELDKNTRIPADGAKNENPFSTHNRVSNDLASRGLIEFDSSKMIRPNFNEYYHTTDHDFGIKNDTEHINEIRNLMIPTLKSVSNLGDSPITNEHSVSEFKREKMIKVRKQSKTDNQASQMKAIPSDQFNQTSAGEYQMEEISKLKVTNDFLRQQCEMLFVQLVEKKKENQPKPQSDSQSTAQNGPKDLDLAEIDGKIIQRKNDFLLKENQMLKKMNTNLITMTQGTKQKKAQKILLYEQLNREMESYIAELQNELGKLISQ